jgi:cAMP phosphodiesterase
VGWRLYLYQEISMKSTITVLGCSGGIGEDLRTTTLLLDDDILIDAGTGVGDLSLEAMQKINTVFLTHSHLDHICSLPLMLDTVGVHRTKPLRVFGIAATIHALKTHIFNNTIWPDFSKIPSAEKPCLTFEVIDVGQTIAIGDVSITALPVNHSIPGNSYWIDSGEGALVFSGDTGPSNTFWNAINAKVNEIEAKREMSKGKVKDYLKHLIIETSFTNAEEDLAKLSGHYHPAQLAVDLQLLQAPCSVWITHLKPGYGDEIMAELHQDLKAMNGKASDSVQALKNAQVLVF